jgi:hypothetical protein
MELFLEGKHFPFKLRGWPWLFTPIIPVLRKQRWNDLELEASLGYIARP